ncbi:MAG TPA: YfhO family protein, partial [Thermomicrobiales bacterium]|nr:YfhO family protein [Thermomicrobiales bacterium]
VAIWLVVALAGVELAVRANTWSTRLWSWFLSAFAVSQILAIWLGQASYYALLVIGGWIAWRTALLPGHPSSLRTRLSAFFLTSLGVFSFGFGLSAAGVLPRLDMVERSSLAGGVYDVASAWAEERTGFSPPIVLHEVLGGQTGSLWWYAGAIAVALTVMAPVIARRWRPMSFFVLMAAASLVLSLADRTPLHALLYTLLPRFEGLHEHSPDRVLILFVPASALLAAATISYLPRWNYSRVTLLFTALVPGVLIFALRAFSLHTGDESEALISQEVTILIATASVIVASFALPTSARVQQTALLGVMILVIWDPAGRIVLHGYASDPRLERSLQESLTVDHTTEAFLYHNGAAAFLAEQTAIRSGRYAGFDSAMLHDPETIEVVAPELGYRSSSSLNNPRVFWLLVHNWGTWFGVEDIQGYNPIQTQRYVEYIDALNGHRQEYHERDLFPAGLSSPLLDLLNLRYLIVPADAPDRPDLAPLLTTFPPVYANEHVRILENPDALPRAWLVHEAQQVAPGEALGLLADGTIDPRQVALLEVAPPVLEPVEAGQEAAELAQVVAYEPDRLELRVTAQSPALLVLSEVWDPGWSATISGQEAPVYLANHTLRAIPIPPGEHQVVLTYDPPFLRVGLAITGATFLVLPGAALWMGRRRPKQDGEERVK